MKESLEIVIDLLYKPLKYGSYDLTRTYQTTTIQAAIDALTKIKKDWEKATH